MHVATRPRRRARWLKICTVSLANAHLTPCVLLGRATGATLTTTDHFTVEEIASWPKEKKAVVALTAYIISDNVWSCVPPEMADSADDGEYMNHSCDPGCEWVNDNLMVATRDIEVGEEVCYDYATSEVANLSPHLPFAKCLCGAAKCRGKVTGDDWRLPELQRLYKGKFTSYVQSLIDGTVEPPAADGAAAKLMAELRAAHEEAVAGTEADPAAAAETSGASGAGTAE